MMAQEMPRETQDITPEEDTEKRNIYCGICSCYYKKSDLRYWSGDDIPQLLCPGCDSTLITLEDLRE